ncbi:hypothetical protein Msip34_2885 (plasmid) [Methylovorus glucosotrophus SIP3-4]|uniref:Uncharacterized protein n=1 Tax=Methylovorus glucosotrophus (strain SIP3-4) TaxID=582744 RepID=C6XEQ2_METGS|nr:hypothetical protein Msip34_2885 [Methylovorus glucosotrophus SIP3-4]
MIEGQQQPLQQAGKVLNPAILELVRKAPFNRFGWAIVDRWALNSPDLLQSLAKKGEVILFNRLLDQQVREQEVILENMEQLNSGLTTMELLSLHNIQTELTP